MSSPNKPRYRTTNWKQYNAALKARGSLSIWLDKRMTGLPLEAANAGAARSSRMLPFNSV
jgi:hypothetical protein